MAITASDMERLFSLLLSPDTEVIRQATAELRSIYKNPSLLNSLCHVMLHSEDPHIRQLSAVVLRKKLVQTWRRLSVEDRESLKNIFIESLSSEMHQLVLRSVANLVSVIASHEFSHNQWPELSQFIMKSCQSDDSAQQEIGMLVLSSVMETAAVHFNTQFIQLLGLFSSALGNTRSSMVPFYALKSLTYVIEYLKDEEMSHFRNLFPKAIEAVKKLITIDEDKACEAMELFDELMECELSLISAFLQQLVEFCLQTGSNVNLSDGIRVKSLSTLGFLMSVKKKSLLKMGFLSSILEVILSVMVSPHEDDEIEDESDVLLDGHSQSPQCEASRVLDKMALNLPPEKLFTSVMQYVQSWLQDEATPIQRKTAITAIGVMAEGCAEHIRTNHLRELVQVIFDGLSNPHQIVKNAALFSLGQFSEHLQPDISQFSSELLPALFQLLDHTLSSSGTNQPSVTRIFYAVETFCENLGSELLPYLPNLMDKLIVLLTGDFNVEYKELAISCIGAVANAVEGNLTPFFPRILDVLKTYINLPYQQELVVLQAQAVDTLGIIAKTIGADNFQGIANECVTLGLTLMNSTDPDLRRSVYGMMASLSTILGQGLAPHLPAVIPRMIQSLQSTEGVKAYYSSTAVSFLDFDKDDDPVSADSTNLADESVESLEDEQDIAGYSVENSYLEAKEDACNAIGEIANNVGILFLPYIDDCFQEIAINTDDSSPGLRKAAVTSLGLLLKVWHSPQAVEKMNEDDKSSLNILINSTLANMSASARTDSDPLVTVATLESIELVLKSLRGREFPIEGKVWASLLVTIDDILNNKAECQEEDCCDGGDSGSLFTGDTTEIEGLLFESAGSLLGPLAAVVGGAKILPSIKPMMTLLIKKMMTCKTVANHSFVMGTLAEIVEGCGQAISPLATDLYPLFMRGLSDKSDEVSSNSVYGIGTLAGAAVAQISCHYQDILQAVFGLASTRSQNGRLMDNITAAVARMIVSGPELVPMDQVLPVLLQNVPLKEDFEENVTVYSCIFHLLQSGNVTIMNNLDLVLKAFAADLSPSSKLTPELQSQIISITNMLRFQCPQQFEAAFGCLPPTHSQVLAKVLAESSGPSPSTTN
ncbi:PREDICTED: importin-4-like [Amphimedon queenslandica]|uniref:Importin N-terminal domain-containing protein n=1 Tax=Amphimedon queenslandica TaxID=400682 RepID=A0A1X7VDT4_AMPQE|nr:PREDICTED: importin-4-like [Amphimedon queenslandica]|eukprot:XP_019849477.1 PREDICTED: importin-4-like [Amphimedon queenslandica]